MVKVPLFCFQHHVFIVFVEAEIDEEAAAAREIVLPLNDLLIQVQKKKKKKKKKKRARILSFPIVDIP